MRNMQGHIFHVRVADGPAEQVKAKTKERAPLRNQTELARLRRTVAGGGSQESAGTASQRGLRSDRGGHRAAFASAFAIWQLNSVLCLLATPRKTQPLAQTSCNPAGRHAPLKCLQSIAKPGCYVLEDFLRFLIQACLGAKEDG